MAAEAQDGILLGDRLIGAESEVYLAKATLGCPWLHHHQSTFPFMPTMSYREGVKV